MLKSRHSIYTVTVELLFHGVLHMTKKEEFVSNRVRQIREIVPQANLLYVQSEMNPADILTRQPKAESLLNNSRWWNGPEFFFNQKKTGHFKIQYTTSCQRKQ